MKDQRVIHFFLKILVCPICKSRFTKKSHLRKHISSVHAKNEEEQDLTEEAREAISNSTPYSCEKCLKTFTTEGKLKTHTKKHETKTHFCGIEGCGKSFSFRKELLKHMKEDHIPTCEICHKTFKSTETLRKHYTIHKQQESFNCPYDGCYKSYTRKSNLNTHIKKIHLKQGEEFKCEICEKIFGYRHTLERHFQEVHENQEDQEELPKKKQKMIQEHSDIFPKTLLI